MFVLGLHGQFQGEIQTFLTVLHRRREGKKRGREGTYRGKLVTGAPSTFCKEEVIFQIVIFKRENMCIGYFFPQI